MDSSVGFCQQEGVLLLLRQVKQFQQANDAVLINTSDGLRYQSDSEDGIIHSISRGSLSDQSHACSSPGEG